MVGRCLPRITGHGRTILHMFLNQYLADASIEENIALGRSDREIDDRKVREVARHAQISKDIDSWEAQYATVIGERGIRLSEVKGSESVLHERCTRMLMC